MLATAHVDVTCYCCCCRLRIPGFSYLPIRSLGIRKEEYYGCDTVLALIATEPLIVAAAVAGDD